MPELPEVETVRSQLEKHVVGLTISSIDFPDRDAKVLKGNLEDLVGLKILGTRRFGKLLVIDCSSNLSLCVHLKMTGRLTLLEDKEKNPSHTHVIFHLFSDPKSVPVDSGSPISTLVPRLASRMTEGGKKLVFSDMRRFGFVHVLPTQEIEQLPFIKKLGKEPLKELVLKDFEKLLQSSARPIKNLLLDQQKIAGIGNIYACEALWIAKISPQATGKRLQKKQVKELFTAIEEVLKEGIDRGGASDNSYRNLLGGKGEYQNFFKVYGQTGKPCLRCGTKIKRIALAGRGTFFCPHCQK